MLPPGLVIFDCDGVLVDSERIAVRVDRQVLERFGLAMTEAEVIERFVGRSPEVMVAAIEEHLGHPLPETWESGFQHLYTTAFETELAAVDGVHDALGRLPCPDCVASSSEPASLRRKLELTGLPDRFEGRMFSASEVANGKPAPDLFLHAARSMRADPERCVVVEDSPYGVRAARTANMRVLAYVGGGLIPTDALEGPATILFDDMRDLPRLLAEQAL